MASSSGAIETPSMRRASPFRSRAGKQIGDACKEVGATFCLDGVASGTAWIDMDYANIGAYITAPQKGWSGPAAVRSGVEINLRAIEQPAEIRFSHRLVCV